MSRGLVTVDFMTQHLFVAGAAEAVGGFDRVLLQHHGGGDDLKG